MKSASARVIVTRSGGEENEEVAVARVRSRLPEETNQEDAVQDVKAPWKLISLGGTRQNVHLERQRDQL